MHNEYVARKMEQHTKGRMDKKTNTDRRKVERKLGIDPQDDTENNKGEGNR